MARKKFDIKNERKRLSYQGVLISFLSEEVIGDDTSDEALYTKEEAICTTEENNHNSMVTAAKTKMSLVATTLKCHLCN
jgi:hypothetical protein